MKEILPQFVFKSLLVFVVLLISGCAHTPKWQSKTGALTYNPTSKNSQVDVYIREGTTYKMVWDKYETQKSLLERDIPSEIEVIGFIQSSAFAGDTEIGPVTFRLAREKGGNAIRFLELNGNAYTFQVMWEVLRYPQPIQDSKIIKN